MRLGERARFIRRKNCTTTGQLLPWSGSIVRQNGLRHAVFASVHPHIALVHFVTGSVSLQGGDMGLLAVYGRVYCYLVRRAALGVSLFRFYKCETLNSRWQGSIITGRRGYRLLSTAKWTPLASLGAVRVRTSLSVENRV